MTRVHATAGRGRSPATPPGPPAPPRARRFSGHASAKILSRTGIRSGGLMYSSRVAVHLVQHPIVQDALTSLRDRATKASHFRRLTHRLSLVVATEATRKLPMTLARVETPMEMAQGEVLDGDVVVVPVLRAGLGMVDAI